MATSSNLRCVLLLFTSLFSQFSFNLVRAVFFEETEGPYWVDEKLHRSDVRGNQTLGVPLRLNFTLRDSRGTMLLPLSDATVDIWQCSYDGLYSDEEDIGTLGQRWLRGYQITDESGHATFLTIYPGWYSGRTTHIHVRVRVFNKNGSISYDDTTQLYFNDTISDEIFTNVYPYNARQTKRTVNNENDSLFLQSNLIELKGSYRTSGYVSQVALSVPFTAEGRRQK